MLTQQIIRDVGPDGNICFDLPDFIGKKVRVIFAVVTEEHACNETYKNDDQEFIAAAYLSAVEEDEAEDALWEKYIK